MCVPTYLSALPASRRTSLSTPTKKRRCQSPCLKIPWVRRGSTVRPERLPFPASPSAPGQRAETGHPRSGLFSRGACSVSGDLLTVVLGYEREHINAINYVIMSPEGKRTWSLRLLLWNAWLFLQNKSFRKYRFKIRKR